MAVSLQEFVENLARSGLMSADEISSFQQGQPAEKQPKDAQTFAQALVHAGKLTKYQAQMVYQGQPKGLVFGEYTVLDKLGQGGMGVVLKARHRRMDRLVAVKMLPARAMKSPDAVKRFYREVQAAAKLTHPNIVTAYDAGEHEGVHYLVMEFVDGKNLAAVVKERGPLEVKQALDFVLQAAKGLAYAHGQGVVHRDIKPGNLLVDKSGAVKILDMGLARVALDAGGQEEGDERLTQSGQVMGTCDYMAPEQAQDTHKADQRSDIYSLGCTLHRLLTGEVPFHGDTLVSILLAHQNAPIPSLRAARSEVPEGVEAIFQKMMAKRPEDRYPSMGEVIADLEACLASRRPAAVVAGSEPDDEASVDDWLGQISAPGPTPSPVPSQHGEATQARRAEDDTHKTIAKRPATVGANRRWRLAAGVGGGIALLLILIFVLARGGKAPDTAQRDGGEKTARTQPAPKAEEKASSDFPDLTPPMAEPNAPLAAPAASPPKSDSKGTAEKPAESQPKAPAATDTSKMREEPKAEKPAEKPAEAMPERKPPQPSEPSPKEAKRHPIPSAETQRAVGATIEETYRTSAAKTPEEKVKLANEVFEAAKRSAKPEEQYVLYRKAVDLACEGGDAALMLELLGPMTDAFAVDPLLAKAAMLERFAKGPRTPARVQALADASRDVLEEAEAEDRYETASGLAKTVADACSRGSPQVRKETADRRKRVQQAQEQFGEVQRALEALKANAGDAAAHRKVGAWYCFMKDDWKRGLPHLSKGSDAVLKSLAERELASPPASPEEQLKLADAWWDAAAERRGEETPALLDRAGHWYGQAAGKLDGIHKTKATKRLSQIAEAAGETSSPSRRQPTPAIAPFDAKAARGYQLRWARYLKVPVEFTNAIGMRFILIPPGEFDMGSTQEEVDRLLADAAKRKLGPWSIEWLKSEAPRHRVRITKAFYMGACEVTQAQYEKVIGSNPSRHKESGPHAPVERVSWDDVVAFCKRLSEVPGPKTPGGAYRLPTEAEWEYSARAGTTTAFCFGDDEAGLSDYAWWARNSDYWIRPVGRKRPNSFGLFDVHGNVQEWCADWYSKDYYQQSTGTDPAGPSSGSHRVMRGGRCNLDCYFHSAFREVYLPDFRSTYFGFRVAKSITP